jgi:hypothetical protein
MSDIAKLIPRIFLGVVCLIASHAVFEVFHLCGWYPEQKLAAIVMVSPLTSFWILSTVAAIGMWAGLDYLIYRRKQPLKAEGRVTIQTGFEADYNLRTSSPFGEILHIIRVKITNATKNILTEARLSVANLNPANVGGRDFPLVCGIALAAGESTYVNVSSHLEGQEETASDLMCLQTSTPSGAPEGYGILKGEHRLQLQLARNEKPLVGIYCHDHNVMRLERLDGCLK